MSKFIAIFLLMGCLPVHAHYCQDVSEIDKQFLEAHNKRRKQFHEDYGVSFVPLKHSPGLKQQSRRWARKLVNRVCSGEGNIYHDPNNRYGENIASNQGTGSWAKRPTPDSILYRFVERELDQQDKGHLTQVLWRPTKYVGCAMVSKTVGQKSCHVTVCRYAKPGNCNMGKYPDWEAVTYQDDSACGPECPPEGCR